MLECADGVRVFDYEAFAWWLVMYLLMASITLAIWNKVKKPLTTHVVLNIILMHILWMPLLIYVMGEAVGTGIVVLFYPQGDTNE